MLIKDVMTHPPKSIDAAASLETAAELMALHDVGSLPVCKDGTLVGIVTDRDIVTRALAPGLDVKTTQVSHVMTADPITVTPGLDLTEAAHILTDYRVGRLPVVEDGKLVGVLSADDVARKCEDDAAVLRMTRRLAPQRRASAH